ncbi:unnamed protein product [Paramecium primaurelia]|uniref:Tetratricopeptide repeat protein n=1 Tax=Paramecium primaurelia TaxID=5886 RepID=A0A8S1LJP2_PARPR|nr:unnamed protein product [Paramecium primaurelia]
MDEPEFLCHYDGHDEEEIIGFCINKNCQQNVQFCLKCSWDKHGDHEEDCKTFKQIYKILQNNKQQQTGQNDEVNNKLKSIQIKCEQLSQSKNIGNEKFDELEKNLKEKEYQNCLANIQLLKNIQDQNQSNQKLILEQLDNILQTLNTLGIPQISNTLKQQSQNTDNIQKVEMKNQEIQVNIEEEKKEEIQTLNNQEDEITYQKQNNESQKPKDKYTSISISNQEQSQKFEDQKYPLQTPQDPISNAYQQTLQHFYTENTPSIINPYQKSNPSSKQPPIFQVPQNPITQSMAQFSEQNLEQRQIQNKSNGSQSEIIKQKFEQQLQTAINKNPEYKNNPHPLIKLTDLEWEQYKNVIISAQDQNQNFVLDAEVINYYDDEYKKVLEECDKSLEKDPFNIQQNILKCKTLIKTNRNQEALECSELIMDMDPLSYQPYILKGVALNQLKRYEEALHNYCISLQIEPNFEAYLLQGISLLAINQWDDAIVSFENSIKMRPQMEDGYYHMGLALMHKQKYEQAIKYFEITLRISPKHSQAQKQKTLCLNKVNQYSEAIHSSDATNQKAQSEEYTYYNKGLELFNAEKYREALQQFEKAIQINQNMHEAHAYRGETLHNLGRLLEAIKSFDDALTISAKPQYMIKKAETLKEMNNFEAAQLLQQKAQLIMQTEKQNPQQI